MRQSGKDRAFAGLIKAFADHAKVSLRTAQRYAKTDHDDWKRYVQGQATVAVAKGPVTPTVVLPPPAELGELPGDVAEPERVLRDTLRMWRAHYDKWDGCMHVEQDQALALSHAAMCIKLREAYYEALRDFEQWQVEQRRVIPVNEFAAMRTEVIIPWRNLMQDLPSALARLVNPKDPGYALSQITVYRDTVIKPAVERWLRSAEAYGSQPTAA